MNQFILKITAKLPATWQQALKRRHYAKQIGRGAFVTGEPEYQQLDEWLSPGDWAIDVGANIGHYTLAMSKCVGPQGRVFAIEPIPDTFELLATNSGLAMWNNITLINAAASCKDSLVWMSVPVHSTGRNFYEASIQEHVGGDRYQVLGVSLDSLPIPHRVALVKIDAEGHESSVIEGMKGLLARDKPTLIVEGSRASSLLESLGYASTRNDGSPNFVWRPA
jgi:FkbM family methyltransferase